MHLNEKLFCLFALFPWVLVVIHDVDHTGVSNAQLSNENPSMAEKYKSRSVAEQNSVDIAWDLLMEPRFQSLRNAIFSNEADLLRFRQLLVNMVMATDIFEKDMKAQRNLRWERVFHSDVPTATPDELTHLKATIVIEHIIQAADVAHTMQHWQVYTKWNERLFQEMYAGTSRIISFWAHVKAASQPDGNMIVCLTFCAFLLDFDAVVCVVVSFYNYLVPNNNETI
jgi:hypothetical protein